MTFLLLYGADKELKYLSKLSIKRVKLLTLARSKYFFVYHSRKENIITKYAFVGMIVYYIINILGLLLLLVHFITMNDLLLIFSCVMFFLNLSVFMTSAIKISLNREQQKIKLEDQKKIRNEKLKK